MLKTNNETATARINALAYKFRASTCFAKGESSLNEPSNIDLWLIILLSDSSMITVQQKCHVCLVALTPFIFSVFGELPCCQCGTGNTAEQCCCYWTDGSLPESQDKQKRRKENFSLGNHSLPWNLIILLGQTKPVAVMVLRLQNRSNLTLKISVILVACRRFFF